MLGARRGPAQGRLPGASRTAGMRPRRRVQSAARRAAPLLAAVELTPRENQGPASVFRFRSRACRFRGCGIECRPTALRALIVFRDALRQHPPLRKAYSSLKEDLARKHQSDRDAYSNAKTEFVQSVLEAAGVGLSSRTPV